MTNLEIRNLLETIEEELDACCDSCGKIGAMTTLMKALLNAREEEKEIEEEKEQLKRDRANSVPTNGRLSDE